MRAAEITLIASVLLASSHLAGEEPPFFRDRTEAAGIDFLLNNSPTLKRYLIETMTGGCAFLDYDADGLIDIFLVNGAALPEVTGDQPRVDKSKPKYWNRLYRNVGKGRFEDVTAKARVQGRGYGLGVAVGDYDNDGYPDLYVTNYGRNELYHNEGDGTFREVTDKARVSGGSFSSSAAFLDYDKDGYLDLFVVRYVDWSFSNNIRCGTSEMRDYCHPKHFKGVPDLLYRNNGDGTFSDVSSELGVALPSGKGLGIALGDFNRDGWADVYVANDSVASFLFRNEEGKALEEIGLLSASALNEHGETFAGMGTDFKDYDNDGWPDIFVTALSLEGFVLFRNNRDETFSDVSAASGVRRASFYLSGWGTKIVDFDNDGMRDVFVANSHVMRGIEDTVRTLRYAQPLLMLRNGGSRFADVTQKMGPEFRRDWVARGAAFGDYDSDGDVDILVQVLGGRPLLLENLQGNRNQWVGFGLEGTASNRDAIGADVKVVTKEGNEQHFYVSRASSYLSSNDVRITAGLGKESPASVEITWPSGRVQEVAPIRVGEYVKIREEQP